ncbi:hypothetical protein NECAME_01705 [Necator americanus]|uniref:Uncharacterized protein n=1 Tax=Necator americanus TaxID=51031 RepID=W2TSC5_NECAM|nr:hypothetical protein NECAME_01705 [Necator americanus]ETN83912.1 hypothetical protein NECAME_01705 [Necator americanus]
METRTVGSIILQIRSAWRKFDWPSKFTKNPPQKFSFYHAKLGFKRGPKDTGNNSQALTKQLVQEQPTDAPSSSFTTDRPDAGSPGGGVMKRKSLRPEYIMCIF